MITFNERQLTQNLSLEIRIERGPFHPFLMRLGMWVMTIGARIAGVGHVKVIDEREID